MEIVWDEVKRRANLERHGMDFVALDLAFFEGATLRPSHSGRWRAINEFHDRWICVIFVLLGTEAISVISMRPASRQERKLAND